ncbi:GNAT family N-acetyltransferase [Nocardia blacklockiae]|uniref:GNAT family N-acetyltransferase n=1 Tax=Nocardia blacklockiae TaxID=480036 RepID=UPI0018930330|nr:GNAT family N-acetyltransferase [Nocardia blacklockiae]MBF6170061.1 GNAT family N-acetyltransferase [Nocardia blacklockiae]
MSEATSGLVLARYDAVGTLGLADELKSVYLASHRDQQGDPWYAPDRFWERLNQIYAPIPEFELVTGRVDGALIGYAFGTPYRRPEEVWDKATHAFPALGRAASGPVYIFREFAVHPMAQGRGYARRIHDALLSERPEPLAYLLVRVGNPAREVYESWGWCLIGQTQSFADSPVMDELARPRTINGSKGAAALT